MPFMQAEPHAQVAALRLRAVGRCLFGVLEKRVTKRTSGKETPGEREDPHATRGRRSAGRSLRNCMMLNAPPSVGGPKMNARHAELLAEMHRAIARLARCISARRPHTAKAGCHVERFYQIEPDASRFDHYRMH